MIPRCAPSTWIAPTRRGAARLSRRGECAGGALHPERALALAERGASLAKLPADIVALNMLRGRLCCESGQGIPAVDAYQGALAATAEPPSGAAR